MEAIINNNEVVRVNSIQDLVGYDLFQNGFESRDQLDTYRQVLENSAGNNHHPQVAKIQLGDPDSMWYQGAADALYLGTRHTYVGSAHIMAHYWYTKIDDVEHVVETSGWSDVVHCAIKVSDINAGHVTFN